MTTSPKHEVLVRAIERINAKTEPDGDCIMWTGYINPNGYGYLSMPVSWGKRIVTVARLVAEYHHGPPSKGGVVLHSCDRRACVAPGHLRWGTQQENMQDRLERSPNTWGEQHHASKYSTSDVETARQLHADGMPIQSISNHLDANYYTVYGWIKKGNRPNG